MDITSIIAEIDAEIERLQKAHVLLANFDGTAKEASVPVKKPAKRKLGAAARKRIGDAQRKRWAATKKAAVPAKAAPAKKHEMSAEARKRIAAAQKKRWAKIKAGKKAVKAVPAKKLAKKVPVKKSMATTVASQAENSA